jgi:hypothetical protein
VLVGYEVPFTERPRASGLLLLCSMPSLVTNHSPPVARRELDRGSVDPSLTDDNHAAATFVRILSIRMIF